VPSRCYQDPLAIAVAMALLLLWHCRYCGVAPLSVAAAAVAAVSRPLAHHAGAVRSNSNTPPLLVLHTKQKSTKSRTIPNQKQSHKILVDLIKTSAVKTPWEKHLLVGKRVPTHACRQDVRTCSTKETFFSLPIPYHPHPLFFAKEPHPLFLFEIGVIHRIWVLCHRG